jgi:hypothetical protein
MTSWKLPLIVAAITVPIVAAFAAGEVLGLGGSGMGMAAAALTAAAIIVIAARQHPRGAIESASAEDGRRHVLLVSTMAVEEPAAVAEIAREAGLGPGEADVLVLAPARIRFLDRWASDVEGAREAAQRNLVATVAALAKAGVEAEARVGDEDVVQAVEDQLQTYPATEVVLVSDGAGPADEEASAELGERLAADFRHVVLR